MQVIFLKDIPKVAHRGDVKNVSDGHAQNYLFPRGLAEKATPAKIAALEANKAHSAENAAAQVAALVAKIKAADGVRYEIVAKADKTGHLYQKIDAAKIATLLALPESIIVLDHPLKEVGEHSIALTHEKVNATAIVAIVAA
jgi:large subunit ribosomal protein L9